MREYGVHCEDGGGVEPIGLPGDVVDQVEDELEEGSLVEGTQVAFVELVDDESDGFADVLQVDAAVVRHDLQEYDYEFAVLVDVPVVQGLTVLGLALQGLLSRVLQGEVEELLDFVVVSFVEALAQAFQWSLDFLELAHPLLQQLASVLFVGRVIVALPSVLPQVVLRCVGWEVACSCQLNNRVFVVPVAVRDLLGEALVHIRGLGAVFE